jgi:glycosyltransferase involved in cell wall biosynthesis/ribosomal protein S18 acetylase RimI-like enzyme
MTGQGVRPRVAHVAAVDATLRFLLLGQLRRLLAEGFDVTAISAPGPWVADLEAEGIRHLPWPEVTRAWDPRADVRAFRSLLSILRREPFDLVHTHTPKPGIMGRLAARVAGVPRVVNTVHGLYVTPGSPPSRRLPVLSLEWAAARLSDLELYQSEEDLRWARRIRLVPRGRSRLLGNGTDLSRFDRRGVDAGRMAALRADLGFDEGDLVVGTVGRLVAEKGYREFIEAARRVRRSVPGVRFLAIAPPEPTKGDAIGRAEMEAAADVVTFTGWREDVPHLLALMDLFVLASWREGMPRSAIEAAAMGVPLVLTDVRGCREVARAAHGLLVPPRAPDRLAAAVEGLLRNAPRRAAMASAARRAAEERFDERTVADILVASYRQLLRADREGPRGPAGVRLRRATSADAGALAALHRDGLPDAFLPLLGDRFLRALYRALADDPGAVALVAEEDGRAVGFAAGVPSVAGFYRSFLARHGVPAAVAAAPRLVRKDVRIRLRETARYPRAAGDLPQAELLSIAVAPQARGRSIGRALARGVVDGLAAMGVGEVKVVVAADNAAGNGLYAALGFRRAATFDLHPGVASNVWVIRCRSS